MPLTLLAASASEGHRRQDTPRFPTIHSVSRLSPFSSKQYALRAMLFLSSRHGSGPVQVQDIAAGEEIPRKFLETILAELKNAGLLISRRGAAGGYTLRRAPDKITFAEVIRIVDGPLAPVNCVSHMARERCPRERRCRLRPVMGRVRDMLAELLEGITFADALDILPSGNRK